MAEIRVYLVDIDKTELDVVNCSDYDFMDLAETQGTVYTLKGFVDAFNNEEVNSSTQLMRIITV